ncbi:MAG: parvulin-like peptidyl-prolyl isomerase [Parcubacteria group bacterium Gr01-1014_48]|nr:MAG: parvulin-like peptidyl-prolyl isomerase [Parcubacteria group bacterium Greene0416_14]TSC73251.1 MAG: parvulin-like peptidyl-prolyl isomerase [Parcubacteria group bacterium Gr01-1014_48]TSD01128.1 MAG: parvulin-like peptidyl-prolyl isomerase [Parcubacteria group bacterium Greene1014_15]TSD08204.1 MAG: parvulin-like peptidyl-prolyl isomerase [Parcubacteria group bacterium Greene0714_4]
MENQITHTHEEKHMYGTHENTNNDHGYGEYGETKKRSKKIIAIGVIIVLVGVVLFVLKGYFVAASVNGSFISRSEVVRELEKKNGKQVLDMLITQRLILDEAKKQDITVPDEETSAKIKVLADRIVEQGGTLAALLAAQGLTEESLREQVELEMKLEKLIADKITVTDEEVAAFIKENKIKLVKGKEEETKAQISEQIKGTKLNTEAETLISGLREQAKIKYFGNYNK